MNLESEVLEYIWSYEVFISADSIIQIRLPIHLALPNIWISHKVLFTGIKIITGRILKSHMNTLIWMHLLMFVLCCQTYAFAEKHILKAIKNKILRIWDLVNN